MLYIKRGEIHRNLVNEEVAILELLIGDGDYFTKVFNDDSFNLFKGNSRVGKRLTYILAINASIWMNFSETCTIFDYVPPCSNPTIIVANYYDNDL